MYLRSLVRALAPIVLSASVLACGGRAAHDRGAAAPASAPFGALPVSVSLESPGGGELPSALQGGTLYYAGQDGQPYVIRLTNNGPTRVEVVVTVDGRDVVSGELGNYKKQRGYIVEPFSSIVVDGFRQSMAQVAGFRFGGLEGSYTALRGTPQHAGVIGIAVFDERASKKKSAPLAVGPGPSTTSASPADASARDEEGPQPFAGDGGRRHAAKSVGGAADMEAAEPSASAPATARDDVGGVASPGFAPPPVPRNELGTEYGESHASSVHEVEFKRRHKRKPDAVFSIYYDSERGLAARGIRIGSGNPPRPFG